MLNRIVVVTGLAALLLATALPAQDSDGDTADPAAEGQQESEEREREAPPASEDSPFDYQASEQISEDLSVSFPVDI